MSVLPKIGLLAAMLCLPTHAALSIISSEETVITAESDLDNSGTLVAAVNFTSTSQATAPTINEISFTNQTDLTGVSTNLSSLTNDYATSNYSTSGDAERVGAFDGVFDGRIVNSVNQGGTEINLSLGGLTVGQQYQIQILTGSADGNRTFDLYHTVWDNPGTNVLVDQGNVGPNSSDLAEIYTVVFTTDDGNALFGLKRTAATSQPVLNAYVLSAVPEPSGVALLGLGLLRLAVRRRR